MVRRASSGVALAAAALLLLGSAPAHADVVTFPNGTAVDLARDSVTRAVFPVELPRGVRPSSVRVTPVTATVDGVPASTAWESVHVRWRGRIPAVTVRVDDPDPEAGELALTVKLRSKKRVQFTTFTFARDSADVTAPGAFRLVVDEDLLGLQSFGDLLGGGSSPPFLIQVGAHDSLPSFSVRETGSGPGFVTGWFGPYRPRSAGFPFDVLFRTPGSTDLADPSQVEFHYALDDMPVGESTHTLEIRSPQLADPLEVTFTVVNRRPLALLPILIVLGVGAGMLLRRRLDPKLTLLRARIRNEELIEAITSYIARFPKDENATFRKQLEHALEIARSVPRFASAATYDRWTDAASAEFDAARKAHVQANATSVVRSLGFVSGRPALALDELNLIDLTARWATDLGMVRSTSQPTGWWAQRWGKLEGWWHAHQLLQLQVTNVLWGGLRILVLSTIVMFTGFVLYEADWTGSWAQILAVFTWAFGLDITTASVTSMLSSTRVPPPPVTETLEDQQLARIGAQLADDPGADNGAVLVREVDLEQHDPAREAEHADEPADVEDTDPVPGQQGNGGGPGSG